MSALPPKADIRLCTRGPSTSPERIAAELRNRDVEDPLLAEYDRMTRLMLTLATKLRITPKSNREGVYTAYSPASRRKPWEDDFLDDEPPRKKLWKPDDPNDGGPKPPVV